jgi:hypothetical protein
MVVRIGDQVITTIPMSRAPARILKYPLTIAQLGASDMVEIRFTVDKTFVPALEASSEGGDGRELGVRFFHVSIQ